jgi:hypothetical protein
MAVYSDDGLSALLPCMVLLHGLLWCVRFPNVAHSYPVVQRLSSKLHLIWEKNIDASEEATLRRFRLFVLRLVSSQRPSTLIQNRQAQAPSVSGPTSVFQSSVVSVVGLRSPSRSIELLGKSDSFILCNCDPTKHRALRMSILEDQLSCPRVSLCGLSLPLRSCSIGWSRSCQRKLL